MKPPFLAPSEPKKTGSSDVDFPAPITLLNNGNFSLGLSFDPPSISLPDSYNESKRKFDQARAAMKGDHSPSGFTINTLDYIQLLTLGWSIFSKISPDVAKGISNKLAPEKGESTGPSVEVNAYVSGDFKSEVGGSLTIKF